MVIGYDTPRPTKEIYERFLEELVKGLEPLGQEGLSLMIYGAYLAKQIDVGRSDIDVGMIFPHDVVIDKGFMARAALAVDHALVASSVGGSKFPMRELFQVSPLDIGICRDGRFNSYTDEFQAYFDLESEVIVGPDYRNEMQYTHTKTGDQASMSHNLRKIRQALLFSAFDRVHDYAQVIKGFNSSLSAASRGSKQILCVIDGKVRPYRFAGLGELPNVFPDLDYAALSLIKDLFKNPEKLDQLYRKPDELMVVWNRSVDFFESVIREYIRAYPREIST
jgi:hypothetical protein